MFISDFLFVVAVSEIIEKKNVIYEAFQNKLF